MTQCWLLQTVPGFADFAGFAGVVEITRQNKAGSYIVWMNCAVMNSLQTILTKKLQSTLSYYTQLMLVIFLV